MTTIHDRICAIIADLPGIGKESEIAGGGQRYRYRGIDDIMPSIKTLLAKHGVHIASSFDVMSDATWDVPRDRGGSTRWRHITLSGTFRFYGLEGDFVEVTTIGEGKDSADKAANKGMTAALKYALLQTFAIADGHDDPDAERPESSGRAVSTQPQSRVFAELLTIRPQLIDAGVYDAVVAFAADRDVALRPGMADDDARPVLEFARAKLMEVDA